MKYIENLLKGQKVEWKTLGEVLKRSKGTKVTASEMKEKDSPFGEVKIFAGGKTFAMFQRKDLPSKDIIEKASIIVKSRGVIEFEYYEKPFSHKSEFWSYYNDNDEVCLKYIYYYLKNNEDYFQRIGEKMQMPQIAIPDTDKYKIPLPPIAVQQEIAKILDTFTKLEAELEVELKAELEARKKQYEYYRDSLLSFNKMGGVSL